MNFKNKHQMADEIQKQPISMKATRGDGCSREDIFYEIRDHQEEYFN